MRGPLVAAAAAFVVLVIVLTGSLFTVQQTEQVLITQFGRPVRVISTPGLKAKLPFVQTAIDFDRRLLDMDFPSEEVILGDQRRLIVDSFARFRITDPLQYYQAVGPSEEGIRARLTSVAESALRQVLGGEQLLDVLSSRRKSIMEAIRKLVGSEMQGFGVSIEDVRIRRADLPPENTQAILSRMKSERQRVAAQARAEGAEASAKIRADADLQRTVILANAHATADQLRGHGEADAIALYAAAYQRDDHFFQIWRTLQAYRDAFANGTTRLVVTPQADFLKLLRTAPQPAEASAVPPPPAPLAATP
jgi:membrane protease subunit HflC